MRVQMEFASLLPARPLLKWAGGKSQLLPSIRKLLPSSYRRYAEPFLGGGAVFFSLASPNSLIADGNLELVQLYEAVRDRPDELIRELDTLAISEEDFYRIRSLRPSELSDVERAARFLYLNKTCFNGLHRVNQRGEFNTPFGKRTEISLVDADNLYRCSRLLQSSELVSGDFEEITGRLKKGDFVYFDPPYWPLEGYSDFNRYTRTSFSREDHQRLASHFSRLKAKGVRALLSNSDTSYVRQLYNDWTIVEVLASRQINSDSTKRGKIRELLIANYSTERPNALS